MFLSKLPELKTYIDESFRKAEVSRDSLVYSRGKIDGAEELQKIIQDFGDYIRSQDNGE